MKRQLFLLRHGKSAWPNGVADHARPLATRGQLAVPLVGRRLAQIAGTLDLALVSDARRTRETFAMLAEAFPGLGPTLEPAIYDARPDTLLALVRTLPAEATRVLMVGHNPGFQALGVGLADRRSSDAEALARLERKLPTAGLIHLDIAGDWAGVEPESARLAAFVTPAMLGGVDED